MRKCANSGSKLRKMLKKCEKDRVPDVLRDTRKYHVGFFGLNFLNRIQDFSTWLTS